MEYLVVAFAAVVAVMADPPSGYASLPPVVVDRSVPSTAGTLTVKPGPLTAYTIKNFTADKNAPKTAYPVKSLSKIQSREKQASNGQTYLRSAYNQINMSAVNPTGPENTGLDLASTPSLVPEPQNVGEFGALIENAAFVDGKKWNCGDNCSIAAKMASRYPTRRDHPEDWAAPEVVDVPKDEQRSIIPEMLNDISCCGTYFDDYAGSNRVDSLHPEGSQPLSKLGILSYSGGGNFSKAGNHKAPCRPCSGQASANKFDQYENPETKPGDSMKPEYKSFVETEAAAIPFGRAEPAGDFGSDFHDLMGGVAHRDMGDNPMDYTKMRNTNGHAYNPSDRKVLPVMHHVPELVESLGGSCNGCGDPDKVQAETARCKECSKKNEPNQYYSPEFGMSTGVFLETDSSFESK
jgi:hypothetical protein